MNKKLKMPLLIVLGGYACSLGFYFIWCPHFFHERQYTYDSFLLIAAIVFLITTLYLFPLLLILGKKSLQKVWISLSIISTITLLIILLTPSTSKLIYNMAYYHKLNLKGDKTIKNVEKNESESEILVAKNIETNKLLEDTKEKIETKKKHMQDIDFKLNNLLAINDGTTSSTAQLQAKQKYGPKETDKLKKESSETIRKLSPNDETMLALRSKPIEEYNAKEAFIVKGKSKKESSVIKITHKADNNDLDSIEKEIIFKVQIISSDTLLSKNSPKLLGLKNVWGYKHGGLYKYTVGNERDFKSAAVLQSEFRRKGFVGAFVVAFKNGKRIPIIEAKKLLN